MWPRFKKSPCTLTCTFPAIHGENNQRHSGGDLQRAPEPRSGFVPRTVLSCPFCSVMPIGEGKLFVDGGQRDIWSCRTRGYRSGSRFIHSGNSWSRSGFLSAFFALIGCHGIHVTAGLLWLLTMMAQVIAKGYRADILRRLLCFSLFWHTLDIIWVALFSLVYLVGVAR